MTSMRPKRSPSKSRVLVWRTGSVKSHSIKPCESRFSFSTRNIGAKTTPTLAPTAVSIPLNGYHTPINGYMIPNGMYVHTRPPNGLTAQPLNLLPKFRKSARLCMAHRDALFRHCTLGSSGASKWLQVGRASDNPRLGVEVEAPSFTHELPRGYTN